MRPQFTTLPFRGRVGVLGGANYMWWRLLKLKIWLETHIEFNEKVAAVSRANRSIYKWVLDFIRNVMVVAALAYVAKKSDSYFVGSIAFVANLALCAYCYTYFEMWTVKGEAFSKGRGSKWLAFAYLIFIQLMMVGISGGMYLAIDRIVKAQGV